MFNLDQILFFSCSGIYGIFILILIVFAALKISKRESPSEAAQEEWAAEEMERREG